MLLRRRHRQAEPVEVSAPAGSAKKAEWVVYAVHVGVSVEDLEGLTRDQIKEVVAAAGADPDAEAKAVAELAEREAAELAEREAAEAKAKEEAEAKATAETNAEGTDPAVPAIITE